MQPRLLQFDEMALRARLKPLRPIAACALGLASACRNLGGFADYRHKAGLLPRGEPAETVAILWNLIELAPKGSASGALTDLALTLESLIPGEDDPWNDSAAFADDALAALVYCISTLVEKDPGNAAYALRRTYESTDYLATERLALATIRKQDEARLLAAPCVQLELHRQQRDYSLVQAGDWQTLRAAATVETIFDEHASGAH